MLSCLSVSRRLREIIYLRTSAAITTSTQYRADRATRVSLSLATGKIVELLPSYEVQSRGIYAIYRHGRYLPGKVRVFIDFLAARLNGAA